MEAHEPWGVFGLYIVLVVPGVAYGSFLSGSFYLGRMDSLGRREGAWLTRRVDDRAHEMVIVS